MIIINDQNKILTLYTHEINLIDELNYKLQKK